MPDNDGSIHSEADDDDERVERMCGSKVAYPDLKMARTVRNRREKKNRYKKGTLRIYRCPLCDMYHLTHTKLYEPNY